MRPLRVILKKKQETKDEILIKSVKVFLSYLKGKYTFVAFLRIVSMGTIFLDIVR